MSDPIETVVPRSRCITVIQASKCNRSQQVTGYDQHDGKYDANDQVMVGGFIKFGKNENALNELAQRGNR